MSQFFQIHPENPQPRLIKQAVEIIKKGGVVIYPTDSSYAVGCQMGDKGAIERIKRLRNLDDKHNFTLMCCDLSQLGLFAKVDTGIFRLLKAHTPGPYTFILNATREVPRLLLHPKRRTIGLRVPSHPIALALLEELGEPLMSVTLILPGESEPMDTHQVLFFVSALDLVFQLVADVKVTFQFNDQLNRCHTVQYTRIKEVFVQHF